MSKSKVCSKHDYRSDGRTYCKCIKCGKDKYREEGATMSNKRKRHKSVDSMVKDMSTKKFYKKYKADKRKKKKVFVGYSCFDEPIVWLGQESEARLAIYGLARTDLWEGKHGVKKYRITVEEL